MTRKEILEIQALGDKKERRSQGLFMAEGRKLVADLLATPLQPEAVYITCDAPQMDAWTQTKTVPIRISSKEMERISRLKTPSDVLGIFRIPSRELVTEILYSDLSLVLDDIQDPGNLGTILRLADWFGIRNVICSRDTADCYNPKVVQATMGAIGRVAVHYVDLPEWLAGIQNRIPVYGTFLPGENLYETCLTANGLVILGNEGRGISEVVSGFINRRLFIPPFPHDNTGSESLNVAVAAGIICSEFRRNRE